MILIYKLTILDQGDDGKSFLIMKNAQILKSIDYKNDIFQKKTGAYSVLRIFICFFAFPYLLTLLMKLVDYSQPPFLILCFNESLLQLIIMIWKALIVLLLIIEQAKADKSVILNAEFRNCQNHSQKLKEKKGELQTIPFQKTVNEIQKSVTSQQSQKAPYQYSTFVLDNENYRMIDGILDICPLEFNEGQLINIQINFQVLMDDSTYKKIYRSISFYPEQKQCYSIDLFTLDEITIIQRTKIQLKLKSFCQNPLKTDKIIKTKILFESFTYSQNLVIYQTIDKIFQYIIVAISVAIIFLIFQKSLPCYPLNQENGQPHSISHFDTMMPSHILLKEQNEQPQCAICLRQNKSQQWRTTPCNHIFHKDCIDLWGKERLSCPLCRGSLINSIYTSVSTVDS